MHTLAYIFSLWLLASEGGTLMLTLSHTHLDKRQETAMYTSSYVGLVVEYIAALAAAAGSTACTEALHRRVHTANCQGV